MHEAFAWVFYPAVILCIFATSMTVGSQPVDSALGTTHAVHGVLSFVFLHWIKGSPNYYGQNLQAGLTLWEQLEPQGDWVAVKSYLTLVPTVLLLATLMANDYKRSFMTLHVPLYLLLVSAKLPLMYRVRLFGINSTVGIDDEDDVKRK